MVTAGARVIVCLGGDGTARVAAAAVGEVPLLALSTGTNNVFPAVREATTAGLAAGLVATGAVPAGEVTTRAKLLEARVGGRAETALVDVAVCAERHVASRAVWDPATLTQLFCAFAEPDAIGLSAVLGQLSPVTRGDPHGVTARLAADGPHQVLAAIGPGLVAAVGVGEIERMRPGAVYQVDAPAGVLAVDGERELTCSSRRAAHRAAARRRAVVRGRAGRAGRERSPRPAPPPAPATTRSRSPGTDRLEGGSNDRHDGAPGADPRSAAERLPDDAGDPRVRGTRARRVRDRRDSRFRPSVRG